MTSDYLQGSHPRRFQANMLAWLMIVVLLCGVNISLALAETALPDNTLRSKKVLMLYSYFASTPAYMATTSPLLFALLNAGIITDNLHQEYLDLGRYDDQEYRKYLQEFLRRKYSKKKFDLIITFHGAAQEFVLRDCKDLWAQTPLLSFFAPGMPEPERNGRRSGVVLLQLDFRGTLERALEMFPKTTRVVFATGSGPPERKYVEQARASFEPWQGKLTFEYTIDQSLDEILKRVANLPPNSIVLASTLLTDGRGAILIPKEVTREIARAANAPVFGFYDSIIDTGVIGGSMVIFAKAGTYAGKLATDILSGKVQLPESPLMLPSMPWVPLFDWPQIERWRGDVTKLPENSVFLHRPPTLWGQHKVTVISTIVVFLILTALIAALVSQNRRRKLAEQSIRESEAKYRTLFESASDAIFLMDANNFIDCNQKTLEMFGCTMEQIIGQPPYQFSPEVQPDGRKSMEKAQEKIENVLSGHKQLFEWQHSRYNGSLFDAEVSLNAFSAGGKFFVQAIVRDITDRKRMEAALRESEAKFREIFETIEDLYYETDSEGIITILSPSLHRLTGWNKEDLIGKPVTTVYVNPDDRKRLLLKISEYGYVIDYELLLKKKDGEVWQTSVTARQFFDDNGRPIGLRGLLRDIAERKRGEEERERLISELQKALSEVKKLSGLLPICASCKKIRDDMGYWQQIESYLRAHSEAEFSHGICPECMKELYPEFYDRIPKKTQKNDHSKS